MFRKRGFKEASKRYALAIVPLMIVYALVQSFGVTYISTHEVSLPVKAAVATAVALPLIGVVFVFWRHGEETEDYSRQQQLSQMAEATTWTLSLSLLIGMLEAYYVIEDVPLFLFMPFYFVFFGLAVLRQSLMNRRTDEE